MKKHIVEYSVEDETNSCFNATLYVILAFIVVISLLSFI